MPESPRLILPTGYYAYSMHLSGTSLPHGAAVTGCGENTGDLDVVSLATALKNEMKDEIMPFLCDDVVLDNTYVRLGDNAGLGPSVDLASSHAGGSTGAPVSPAVALLIRWTTGIGGKRGRGRWYLPGLQEDKIDPAGVILNTTVTSINTALTTFLANLVTAGCPIAIGHRYQPVGGVYTGLAPTVIVAGQVDNRAATQRNRQRR